MGAFATLKIDNVSSNLLNEVKVERAGYLLVLFLP